MRDLPTKSVPWLLRPGNSLRAACETSIMNASVIVVRLIHIGSNSSGVDIKLSVDRLVKNNTDHIDIATSVIPFIPSKASNCSWRNDPAFRSEFQSRASLQCQELATHCHTGTLFETKTVDESCLELIKLINTTAI
jgi:hypothetical protein